MSIQLENKQYSHIILIYARPPHTRIYASKRYCKIGGKMLSSLRKRNLYEYFIIALIKNKK